MQRFLVLLGLCLVACQSPSDVMGLSDRAAPQAAPKGGDFLPDDKAWQLVWSDEFSGDELDRAKWQVEESCWGGGNEERQCYVDWPGTVSSVNGLLRILAYRQTVTGPEFPEGFPDGRGDKRTQKYVSGKVLTKDIASWTYGRFSARMKLPKGQGTWPAFWMLPADNAYGRWAASGEIDIMEAINLGERCKDCNWDEGENRTSGALHFGGVWPDNTYHARFAELPGSPGVTDDYHVYSVEWAEGHIHWYVDDRMIYSLKSDDWFTTARDKTAAPYAPFDQDFYLILNLAVGGKLPESNNKTGFDPGSFPAELLVDWVRVYQCEGDSSARSCLRDR